MPWRHLLDEGAYAADDVAGSIGVLDDSIESLPDLLQISRVAAKPPQSGMGIGDRCGDRLIGFFASIMRPSKSQMQIPMMLESTRRRTFDSRSWRSL
jgi:hypothetical protein